jgi:CYTH domain-containing protein
MGKEVERKFLVRGEGWKKGARGRAYLQGYLSLDPERTVRVRLAGDEGLLTVKGRTTGMTRSEFEYGIPSGDALFMLENLCLQPLIEKTRYRVEHGGMTWEVDEFSGANSGLVIAEIELAREDQSIVLPAWAGTEVTGDPGYFNASLVLNPWNAWQGKSR